MEQALLQELGCQQDATFIEDRLQLEQNEAIREALDAIQELHSQLEQTQRLHQTTVQAYKKEREAYKLMIHQYEHGTMASLDERTTTQIL